MQLSHGRLCRSHLASARRCRVAQGAEGHHEQQSHCGSRASLFPASRLEECPIRTLGVMIDGNFLAHAVVGIQQSASRLGLDGAVQTDRGSSERLALRGIGLLHDGVINMAAIFILVLPPMKIGFADLPFHHRPETDTQGPGEGVATDAKNEHSGDKTRQGPPWWGD